MFYTYDGKYDLENALDDQGIELAADVIEVAAAAVVAGTIAHLKEEMEKLFS